MSNITPFAALVGAADDKEGSIAVDELGDARPVILLRPGGLCEARDTLLNVLARRAAAHRLYVYGGRIVEPVTVTRVGFPDHNGVPEVTSTVELVPINVAELRARLSRIVDFRRTRDQEHVACDCPRDIASSIVDSGTALLRLPQISRVSLTPLLVNGRVIVERGLHHGVWLDTVPVSLPAEPTQVDAENALGRILEWLEDFPFAEPVDETAAVAMLMTAALRTSLTTAPAFVVTKPVFGAGATTLAKLAGIVATGRTPPVVAASTDPNELDKALRSALLSGGSVIALDNLPEGRALTSTLLAQMLTERNVSVREMGRSVSFEVDAGRLVVATGVNVHAGEDLARRSVAIALDPRSEAPADRRYRRERIVEQFTSSRGRILADLLTITLAHARSGYVTPTRPLAGFEQWARHVVAPIVWLGREDLVPGIHAQSATDATTRMLAAVLPQLEMITAQHPAGVPVRNIINVAPMELKDVLAEAVGCGITEPLHPRKLGVWFNAVAKRVVDGRRLIACGTTGGRQRWSVERLE